MASAEEAGRLPLRPALLLLNRAGRRGRREKEKEKEEGQGAWWVLASAAAPAALVWALVLVLA